jgi:anti-sigma B factor antagonist
VLETDASSPARTGYVVVALRGELDTTNAAGTARILQAAVAPQLQIIVDLAEVTFMDCRSVRELVSMRTQAQQAGGALLLAGPQPRVRRLLSLLDLIGLLPAFTSVEEAVNGCQKPTTPWRSYIESNGVVSDWSSAAERC